MISTCQKQATSTGVCGNGIFEPTAQLTADENVYNSLNNRVSVTFEQCDNGNQLGCRGCVVENGWTCKSEVGKLSLCLPNIITPTCGNGQL